MQVCPTDAIVMMKSFDLATTDRRELLLDKDRLHAIGLQHEVSWGVGTKLRDMQNPPPPPKKPLAEGASAAKPAEGPTVAQAPKPAQAPATAETPKPADISGGGEA